MENRPIFLASVLSSIIVISTSLFTATVAGNLSDFTLSSQFYSITVRQSYPNNGSSTGFNLILTSVNGFVGTVMVSDTAPPGFTVSGPPYNVTLTSGATVKPSISISSTVTGTYNITVTGESGSLVHSIQISVTVTPASPDFSVSLAPSSMNVQAGASGNATITVTSLLGFSGTVSLAVCVNNPVPPCPVSSVTGSANPSSIALVAGETATSILMIHTSSSTVTGSYAVWIDATEGSHIHQTVENLGVGPYFTIAPSPSNLTVHAGATNSSTLLLTSHADFSFTANFQLQVSTGGPPCPPYCPQIPTVTISPSTISLTPFGTGRVYLTISTNANTTVADYTIYIDGGGCVCVLPTMSIPLAVTDPSLSVGGTIVPSNIVGSLTSYAGTVLLILGAVLAIAIVARLRKLRQAPRRNYR